MEYRRPVFNGLANFYSVSVLHSGKPSTRRGDLYREIVTPQRRSGPFYLQPGSPLGLMIRDFDAVIAMFDLRWPSYLVPLFWRGRPTYILWGHWYSGSWVANAVRDMLMRKADGLLMYSDEEINKMVERGIDGGRIVVAPNTVHVENPIDLSSEIKNRLLFIGRLEASSRRSSKRADILLEVFSRLQGRISDSIGIDIVGEGSEKEALKKLAARLGILDKIIFHGHVNDERVIRALFRNAIALVSPGHVGLSVLQSFAHGVPVVTGKTIKVGWQSQHVVNALTGQHVIIGPEYYNLKNGVNSLLFETQVDMDGKIELLCNDAQYRAELGRNAYQHYVEERSLSRMLAGFREAIEK